MLLQAQFQDLPQMLKAIGQLPAGSRRRLFQRPALVLQQSKIVQRIENGRRSALDHNCARAGLFGADCRRLSRLVGRQQLRGWFAQAHHSHVTEMWMRICANAAFATFRISPTLYYMLVGAG